MYRIIFVLLFLPGFLFSQMNQKKSGAIEGKLSLAGGMYTPDITALNQYLETASLPVQSLPYYTLGLVYQIVSESFISDLEFHWSLNQGRDNGTYQVAYRSNIQLFNVGYLLVNAPFLHLYPLVGVGRGAVSLESSQIATPTFTQVLTNGISSFRLDNSGLILNLSLSLDFLIPAGKASSEAVKNLVLGIRGGYLFDFSDEKWDSGGIEVSGGPQKMLSGAYLRLLLGMAI